MKQTIILLLAVLAFSTATMAQTNVSNSATGQSDMLVVADSVVADSATLQIQAEPEQVADTSNEISQQNSYRWGEEVLLPIVVVGIIFGTVMFIVYFSLTMRQKERKAQYELAMKALEMGKEIPEGFLERKGGKNMLIQGIMSTALGLGLFFLIMGITKEPGLSCIGILVMLYGIGKIVCYYLIGNTRKEKENCTEE